MNDIKKRIVELININFEYESYDPELPVSHVVSDIPKLAAVLSAGFEVELGKNDVTGDMNLDYLAKAIQLKLK